MNLFTPGRGNWRVLDEWSKFLTENREHAGSNPERI